jgi:hypothetical protein
MDTEQPQKKPTIPEVIPLVKAWYALPGNDVGGIFHVMLDDGNWEQCFANSALQDARELGDPQAIELAEKLAAMSGTQRRKIRKVWFRDPPENDANQAPTPL